MRKAMTDQTVTETSRTEPQSLAENCAEMMREINWLGERIEELSRRVYEIEHPKERQRRLAQECRDEELYQCYLADRGDVYQCYLADRGDG
jgi:hypothetical protein